MADPDIIQEAEGFLAHELERVFPPKPGGLIDRERKKRAREAAIRKERELEGSESPQTDLGRNRVKAVRTIVESGDLATAMTVTLGSLNQWSLLLPGDQHRRSAVVLAIDNDVYLTHDQGSAISVAGTSTGTQGFYLPAGIAVPVESTAPVYVAATTTTTNSRVSAMIYRESAP